MKLNILVQDKTAIFAVEEIKISQDKKSLMYNLEGIKESGKRILLGTFKTFYLAERVLLNIVEQCNIYPNTICIIPEDDEEFQFNRDVLVLPYPTGDESERE